MKFRHSAIVCENIDRMEEFYKIFEFKNLSAKLEVGSYIEDLTKIKNNKLFWKKYVNQEGDILELIKYENIKYKNTKNKQEVYQRGFSHIAFTVKNINLTLDSLIKKGGSIINKPIKSPDGKVLVCYAYDVEGNLLELVEELNV
tara:strand:- start:398 stop:829 length:432 start_codon:yes stop_codon:yes gene_type:complete